MLKSVQRMLLMQNYLFFIRHEIDPAPHMHHTVEEEELHYPRLEEVCEALQKYLPEYFAHVTVEVTECPDLHQPPFNFPARGICGGASIVEVGGPPFLLPTVKRDKVYDFRELAKMINEEPVFFIGAGAGPFPHTGVNCEGIYSIYVHQNLTKQSSKISKVNETTDAPEQEDLPQNETRFALLANLFASRGEAGEVVKVHVKKRTGCHDFVTSIRNSLVDVFGNDIVGVGGVFIMKEGSFKHHVMPDFSTTPIQSEEDLETWLQFYNLSAPLVAVGTIVTGELDLDLRLQHFHSFSDHNEAGHYHADTTPDTVEYVGYFNVAKRVVRIDRPEESHNMGRD